MISVRSFYLPVALQLHVVIYVTLVPGDLLTLLCGLSFTLKTLHNIYLQIRPNNDSNLCMLTLLLRSSLLNTRSAALLSRLADPYTSGRRLTNRARSQSASCDRQQLMWRPIGNWVESGRAELCRRKVLVSMGTMANITSKAADENVVWGLSSQECSEQVPRQITVSR